MNGALKEGTKETSGTQTSPNVLADHHRKLDRQIEHLLARVRDADAADLRGEWSVFERALLRHLEQEEAEVLPGFARDDAADAREILADHAAIRGWLLEMGVNLDLHLLRAEEVERFVAQLRDHAKREEAALYAWARRHISQRGWQAIKRSLRAATRDARDGSWLAGRVM
jgi:hemerythrin-like domain-containing protein